MTDPNGDTVESVLAECKRTGRLRPDTDPRVIQEIMRRMIEAEEMPMVVADAWRTKACAREPDQPHEQRLFPINKETRVSDKYEEP